MHLANRSNFRNCSDTQDESYCVHPDELDELDVAVIFLIIRPFFVNCLCTLSGTFVSRTHSERSFLCPVRIKGCVFRCDHVLIDIGTTSRRCVPAIKGVVISGWSRQITVRLAIVNLFAGLCYGSSVGIKGQCPGVKAAFKFFCADFLQRTIRNISLAFNRSYIRTTFRPPLTTHRPGDLIHRTLWSCKAQDCHCRHLH